LDGYVRCSAFTMNLYDYARQPAVEIPPASQVTDVTDKIKASVVSSAVVDFARRVANN
jgi:hypothetical protein